MLLSPHFSLEEFTRSETAAAHRIDNSPPPYILSILTQTAISLEGVRSLLGYPLTINSAYRCLALNRAIGSQDTSDHIRGLAVDFICPGFGAPLAICQALRDSGLMARQIINELTWCHVAFACDGCGAPVIPIADRYLTIDGLGTRQGLFKVRT